MGASSSTDQVSNEQKELESQAASTGSLALLQKAFSKLADSHSNSIPLTSLQRCFSLSCENTRCEGTEVPNCFVGLLDNLGLSITDLLFVTHKEGISWVEFLRGCIRWCSLMPASSSLNIMFRVIAMSAEKAGSPLKLQFESNDVDSKTSGSISPLEMSMILWACWMMSRSSRILKPFEEKENVCLPDVNHLVLSAVVSCVEIGSDFDVCNFNVLGLDVELSAGKIVMWVLRTVPNLADCFS
ncbi:hypothetical protein Nepgr_005085 [Nepenthes gracilis]|uniref:Uncharacterized protein n=1 Tax=Nepenthes gracilis TaxID=150966 RepID=A0AAD3S306_NEPGR|nr:hypothetical protein Nepgr_005085 [Nepenthes gracilis]